MPWGQVLVTLFCIILMVRSTPCSWIEVLTSWNKGYKAVVKFQIDDTVDHWNITVQFSEDVISFEAWKGQVIKISDKNYTISNTCYNNLVYSCQCFQLSYLVNHEPRWDGTTTFKFNGEKVPGCDPPPCSEDLSSQEASNAALSVCKHYDYKSWFELISRCFKLFIHNKQNETCHPTNISQSLSSKIHNVIEELNNTVTNSPNLTNQAELMWNAVQREPFHDWCPGPFDEIVHYLRVVLTQAPPYLPNAPNLYGVPIANMLLCYLHTEEGRSFFASPQVNAAMIKIVNTYGEFLETKESLYVLNNGTFGWKSACALKDLNYMKDFVHDKTDKYWGFNSWNDFFTRNLMTDARPIVGIGNNKIVDAFGDNGFYNIEMNVQNNTKLWMKNESYSLFQMFDKNTNLSNRFIGGTVLQVFFSATRYHHFHAPVSGNVTYAANKHGIIYAVDAVNVKKDQAKLTTLENWIKYGADGIIDTQLYLAHITSRAIIIIENELLGPVALFFIGMTEISSCRIEPYIKKGYEDGKPVYVEKGDKLGKFQYGGSTGAILLTKEVVAMKPAAAPFWDKTLLTDDIKMGQPILYI